jgi:ribonuclease P protein component
MLPKKSRIPRKLFTELLSGSRFVHSPFLTLRFKALTNSSSKAGVSVSKKVSKSAVIRNTVRRRIYATVAPMLKETKNYLFLFVAKPGVQNIKGENLSKEILKLLSAVT